MRKPAVRITCDRCSYFSVVDLADAELLEFGWQRIDEQDVCQECWENAIDRLIDLARLLLEILQVAQIAEKTGWVAPELPEG